MMMFSLRPKSWSDLPSMAASVSTRVVSWKDAADSHDFGGQRRLGDPHQLRAALGRALAFLYQRG